MTTITNVHASELVLQTDDAGYIVFQENAELPLAIAGVERDHGLGIVGSLGHADALLFIGMGIEGNDMHEVHTRAPVGSSSLEAVESAIRALEVVRDGLRRIQH